MPFDHFDFISGYYDRAGVFLPTEQLMKSLALNPDCTLLDAGGGTGRVASVLRPLVGNVTVVDTSRGMLQYARQKGLSTVCAPVENLPFPEASFDRIFMLDALHHVKDQRLTALNFWRVLAPGGRLVIVEPDIHKMAVKAIAIGEKLLLMRSHFLSGNEIQALFADYSSSSVVLYERPNVIFVVDKNSNKQENNVAK